MHNGFMLIITDKEFHRIFKTTIESVRDTDRMSYDEFIKGAQEIPLLLGRIADLRTDFFEEKITKVSNGRFTFREGTDDHISFNRWTPMLSLTRSKEWKDYGWCILQKKFIDFQEMNKRILSEKLRIKRTLGKIGEENKIKTKTYKEFMESCEFNEKGFFFIQPDFIITKNDEFIHTWDLGDASNMNERQELIYKLYIEGLDEDDWILTADVND